MNRVLLLARRGSGCLVAPLVQPPLVVALLLPSHGGFVLLVRSPNPNLRLATLQECQQRRILVCRFIGRHGNHMFFPVALGKVLPTSSF